jgi:citrate synthase
LDKIIKEESETGFLDPEFAASWFRRRMINSLMESLSTGSRESWKRFEYSERIERKLVKHLTVQKKVGQYVDGYAAEIISKLDRSIIQ